MTWRDSCTARPQASSYQGGSEWIPRYDPIRTSCPVSWATSGTWSTSRFVVADTASIERRMAELSNLVTRTRTDRDRFREERDRFRDELAEARHMVRSIAAQRERLRRLIRNAHPTSPSWWGSLCGNCGHPTAKSMRCETCGCVENTTALHLGEKDGEG